MLSIPPTTKFDLNFRLLGIPVRISVWFWVVALMFNAQLGSLAPLMIWIGCLFVSILVHEFGHGLTAKAFGDRPYIVLHGMGGACVPSFEQPFGRRLAVLFMGPGAQLLLLMGVFAYAYFVWNFGLLGDWVIIRSLVGFPYKQVPAIEVSKSFGPLSEFALTNLIFINLFWAVLNLLPIWPLDGGQITQTILSRYDRVHGSRRTHIIGMLTAGAIAIYVATRIDGLGEGMIGFFPVIFFGYFAFINYQHVQAYHRHYVDNSSDDADWWKR